MRQEDLQRLTTQLQGIDQLLRSLSDFRAYPGLLDRNDPELEGFLDNVIASVQDGRLLTAQALERVDEILADLTASAQPQAEQSPQPSAAETAPVIVRPPVDLERITMANPTGMREVVLVADSSPGALHELETILTDADYRVISVHDGFAAVSIYARLWAAIDLVMLDFDLPGMSGELVFEELLAINPHVAAVVSYGSTPPEKAKLNQMLARGLSGFLPRPYESARIIHQIQSVLANRHSVSGR